MFMKPVKIHIVYNFTDIPFGGANQYQQPEDGCWCDKDVSLPPSERVNSAMKMMIAFSAVGGYEFDYPERLIDLCLNTINDGHACNHFNIICVLYYCRKLTDHRKNEIIDYATQRIQLYLEHYWEEYGSFSFFRGYSYMFRGSCRRS